MILRDLVMTVNNTSATLSEPLQIYKYDRGITLKIKVVRYKFIFSKTVEEDILAESSIIEARAIIKKPNGEVFECPRTPIEDDYVMIPITIDWTDSDSEIGQYQLQIQLYGSDPINERVTLPPIGFTVAEPIGIFPEDGVEYPDDEE